MVVLATTAVPDHVHGALSRWMLETMPGMFVGSVSARVRDLLWDNVSAVIGDGAAVLVYPADTEQGFAIRTAGERRRQPYEADGLTLIRWTAQGEDAEEHEVPW
ncbi:type I-E CRISPR-associated endoribonuclease Cas2e [Crossiella sp. SN42]|uniref:type I-E CRISPR-associated endoribonuclease Cas2e n=1 Tax=Crossiella sp. SN42 TaxID=2944808 RepID=UPI00207C575E|nr:type I-E CRISPR-associated endoribonuclease Cas2e [Crossiella sp. SN42]MCO1575840.1 type I-E CRISPR-associated endoribonuclease Cas2e [Crossiella sp. SN42]